MFDRPKPTVGCSANGRRSVYDANDTRSQGFFFFFSVFSTSSLTLRPLKIGLGFPPYKCPFCSVTSSCSSSFYTHIPLNSNSTSSIELNLDVPLSPLPPSLPSTNFCRDHLKCDGTRAETRFRLSAKRTSPFKSAGRRQFSRLLAQPRCAYQR